MQFAHLQRRRKCAAGFLAHKMNRFFRKGWSEEKLWRFMLDAKIRGNPRLKGSSERSSNSFQIVHFTAAISEKTTQFLTGQYSHRRTWVKRFKRIEREIIISLWKKEEKQLDALRHSSLFWTYPVRYTPPSPHKIENYAQYNPYPNHSKLQFYNNIPKWQSRYK